MATHRRICAGRVPVVDDDLVDMLDATRKRARLGREPDLLGLLAERAAAALVLVEIATTPVY